MAFSEEDHELIEAFRTYIEDSVANDDRYGVSNRLDRDDASTLATRFEATPTCWFEVALRPLIPQIRVAFLTNDRWLSEELEQAIQDVTINEINRLTGRTSHKVISFFLSVDYFWNIGVIAPFLGLMGTVTGISKAFGAVSVFSALSKYEFKNIVNSLSGGINEALYTTIGGLVVGNVSLICYYFFVWRIDSVNKALNEAGDVLISKVSMRGS